MNPHTPYKVETLVFPLCFYVFVLFFFLQPHQRHIEVPRLGVEWELWPLAYTTAKTMPDLRGICDLHHSSRQHRFLSLLSEARVEPTSSWMLVGFISPEPQQELRSCHFVEEETEPPQGEV